MEMICRLHAAAIARHDGGSKLNLANAMPTRRLILVPIGLILSIAASFIFLLVAGFAEPAGRRLLEAVGWIFWEAARSNALQGDPPGSFRVLARRLLTVPRLPSPRSSTISSKFSSALPAGSSPGAT